MYRLFNTYNTALDKKYALPQTRRPCVIAKTFLGQANLERILNKAAYLTSARELQPLDFDGILRQKCD